MFEYLRKLVVRFIAYLKFTFEPKIIFYPPTYLFNVAAKSMITFTMIPTFRHPYIGKTEELMPFIYAEWRDDKGINQKALFQLNNHDLSMGSVMTQYNNFMAAAEANPSLLTDYPEQAQQLMQQYLAS